MSDPHGLYWLGPLAWSMALSTAVCLLVGLVFLVGEVRSPRARRNRAKFRAHRRTPTLRTGPVDLNPVGPTRRLQSRSSASRKAWRVRGRMEAARDVSRATRPCGYPPDPGV